MISASVTFGPKGLHYTINTNGTTTKSIGIPGSGLYYRDTSNIKKDKKALQNAMYSNSQKSWNHVHTDSDVIEADIIEQNHKDSFYRKPFWIMVCLLFLPPVGVYLIWAYTNWHQIAKAFISVIFLGLFLVFLFTGVHSYYHPKDDISGKIPEGSSVQQIDGAWGLYKDNSIVLSYNGLADNEYGTWVIENGLVNFSFSGMYSWGGKDYIIKDGKVVDDYSEESSTYTVYIQ